MASSGNLDFTASSPWGPAYFPALPRGSLDTRRDPAGSGMPCCRWLRLKGMREIGDPTPDPTITAEAVEAVSLFRGTKGNFEMSAWIVSINGLLGSRFSTFHWNFRKAIGMDRTAY